MFCSECGKPAYGKFCGHCGTPLSAPVASQSTCVAVEPTVVIDWQREVSYEVLMQSPEVRAAIDAHARLAKKRMTAEQFLALADKLIPQPVSMEGVAAVAQPLWARLGVRTRKHFTCDLDIPVAGVIVRALCSLARHGQPLRGVAQGEQGCTIEAELPSDLFSMGGSLHVSIYRSAARTRVEASTSIEGQLTDWGKSQRCLEKLLGDLRQLDPLRTAA